MTDCGCDKAKEELEQFLHSELTTQDAADIREHLAGCDDCSQEHLVGLVLMKKVQSACQEKAPEELVALVRARLAVAR